MVVVGLDASRNDWLAPDLRGTIVRKGSGQAKILIVISNRRKSKLRSLPRIHSYLLYQTKFCYSGFALHERGTGPHPGTFGHGESSSIQRRQHGNSSCHRQSSWSLISNFDALYWCDIDVVFRNNHQHRTIRKRLFRTLSHKFRSCTLVGMVADDGRNSLSDA